MRRSLVALILVSYCGCESDPDALIQYSQPLNGETAVDFSINPEIKFSGGAGIDLFPIVDRKVVLFDVTGGARATVPGEAQLEGARLTYVPLAPLPADHEFQLEIKRQAFGEGGRFHEVDATEWPDEPISWPYLLTFDTGSRPRVRSAYLDRVEERQLIIINFSQPMNPVVTNQEIQLLDFIGNSLAISEPIWTGAQSVELEVEVPLEIASVYTLAVSSKALAEDGSLLSESFSAKFTGSQQVIRSRFR